MSRLLISFSGGETSAYMTKLIHERWHNRYSEIITVFANATQENDEALIFANRCGEAFGWHLVWVQALISPELGVGTRHRIVDFNTANRDGTVFEEMIAKYGIPGPGFPHCTRELKLNPIRSYARSIGWEAGTYDTAIGIRIDECDRMDANAKKNRIIYPLVSEWPTRKIDVNEFWVRQPFRLNLKGYQGNCKWCWKKSLRKHLTIMKETPEAFDFPESMEAKYPKAGANPNDEVKRFFRKRRTVADIRELSATVPFTPAADDAREYQTDIFSELALDLGGDCDDGCEVDLGEAA